MLIGCIADDFTGATDLANTLVKAGLKTVQTVGVPVGSLNTGDAEAVVVALKSRTIPAADAVQQSLNALAWLRAGGAEQIVFKYCSTFDSTDKGNIGPVADALLDALEGDLAVFCPAFPGAGRTIYNGYLFVGGVLLSESGMQDHPLTPMTDSNLVRVLSRQTPHKVGLVDSATVRKGGEAIRAALDILKAQGTRHVIVDAVTEDDLMSIGTACQGMALVTGGSGVAMGLPANFRRADDVPQSPAIPSIPGRAAVLAGSCSRATRGQVAFARDRWPSFEIDAMRIAAGEDMAKAALDWAATQAVNTPVLIYSSADPAVVASVQEKLGRERAGALVEETVGRIAEGLRDAGVQRMIVAGGETSGAVVGALDVAALRIGPEIDPGVPWTETIGGVPMALALKSGNFGSEDFFEKAFGMLP
jgi:uncharacterized protein YgbK (DUF1537 family)